MSITIRSKTLKATSTWDRDTAPETKIMTWKFKDELGTDGQHSPSTATFSRVKLEHACSDKSTTHANFQLCHSAWKHGHSSAKKEQASSNTNKDEKKYIKLHIPGQKNKHLGKRKTKVTNVIEEVRRRKWTWAGHFSRIRHSRWTLRITTCI